MLQLHRQSIQPRTISNASKACGRESLGEIKRKQKQSLISENAIQKNGSHLEIKREIVSIFCSLLKRIVQQNCQSAPLPSVFNLKGEASMDLEPFIKRVSEHFKCSETCYIVCLILLNRLQSQNPEIYLHSKNIHKLIITGLLVAIKYCDDDCSPNSYYATIAGIQAKELNMLELQFLTFIGFQVYVKDQTLVEYRNKILGYGQRRP